MMKKLVLMTAVTIALLGGAKAADLDATIKNLDGSAIVDDKGNPVELSVRSICVNSLMAPMSAEEQAKPDSGEEKVRREELARHLQTKDDYKLKAEDVVLLKRLVNRQYPSPLVVSQTWSALERK